MDEELEMDESAYEMYHQAQTNAPCLSFDIIVDDLGSNRTEYPHTCFLVSGTQAESTHANNMMVMKMSNLKKTLKDKNKENEEESTDEDSESDDEEEGPELEAVMIRHSGCVNRIRATKLNGKHLAASWSELGKVSIWDLTKPLKAVTDTKAMAEFVKNDSPSPIYQFSGHQSEGFAIDWSPQVSGQLVTGDCLKNIHVWKLTDETTWLVDQRPFVGHTSSVEDIQWSPNEPSVFASCSADKSIRIWDIRASPLKANMLTAAEAHLSDVNVINWNRNEPFLVSGGDDAQLKIWDLRLFKENKAVAILKFHTKPITSVEWNINDSTVFAASGEDNQITIWDLSVEKDDEQIDDDMTGDLPPQLLFIHEGQKEMKELHWHPQIPGVIISTAHTGFNVFKTIST